ncbi:MAG: PLD nuclease N-terminal domain-containing protein [Patescibacteria group bacterium]|nr:PLD nuclease N-terminal domain-containing protein [Patescibacteria group bacterium]
MDYTITPNAADVAAGTAAVGLGIGMILFWVLFVGVGAVIWIWALVDVIRRQFTNSNDKTLWLIIVILLGWIGGIVYLLVGRKKGTIPGK